MTGRWPGRAAPLIADAGFSILPTASTRPSRGPAADMRAKRARRRPQDRKRPQR